MWSRKAFKSRAKAALARSYWTYFAVCLICGIITGGVGIGSRWNNGTDLGSYINLMFDWEYGLHFNDTELLPFVLPVLAIAFLFMSAVSVIGIAYTIFISSPINVGKARFFTESRNKKMDIGTIFYSFRGGHYLSIVKSMAWRLLFTVLWSLLFIIPGIIKAYSYSLVPYILADNPNIGYERALKLSMNMTRGYKLDIFILQLSFLGWYLLGILCFGIGVLFVNPYYESAFAEMYAELRSNAVKRGICAPYELQTGYAPPEWL